VVSSTWDSVDRPAQYLAWARRVAAVTLLVNGPAFIEWGIDKTHQRELEAAGVPVIPTVWVTPGQQWQQPDSGEFVVKPSVSAGARNTARYAAGDSSAVRHVRELLGMGQTVMVQDYQAATGTGGETDIVYFDGIFSHAVNKKFPLTLGRGVIERPWEHISWGGLVVPSPAQLAVAEAVFSFVRDRLGRHPAYGRVDLVDSTDDGPVLLELELIDPYLSLDVAGADAAGRLARAVLRA
jgi:hypothetical protein